MILRILSLILVSGIGIFFNTLILILMGLFTGIFLWSLISLLLCSIRRKMVTSSLCRISLRNLLLGSLCAILLVVRLFASFLDLTILVFHLLICFILCPSLLILLFLLAILFYQFILLLMSSLLISIIFMVIRSSSDIFSLFIF